MKKRSIILLAVSMAAILCSCNNQPATVSEVNEKSTGISSEIVTENSAEQSKASDSKAAVKTYKLPFDDITLEMPDYHQKEEGYTELFIVPSEKYIAITSYDTTKVEDVQEAHRCCFEKMTSNLEDFQGGINELKISSEENVEKNGMVMYKTEGEINYGTEVTYDGYEISYAFVINGNAYEILGSVINKEQDTAAIKVLQDEVEKIVASIHTGV